MSSSGPVSFDEARTRVLERVSIGPTEFIGLEQAAGRTLAQPVVGAFDSPRFDHSAVDGYGFRLADLPGVLRLAGRVSAGEAPSSSLGMGETVRILTGAPIPDGVEAVVMQEEVRVDGSLVHFEGPARAGANIRRQGEEYRAGDLLLPRGVRITPPRVGLAASNGLASLEVYRKPRVAVMATGSELVPPGESLPEGAIYESNAFALAAAVEALGGLATRLVVQDDEAALRSALAEALEGHDFVITSGGVSVGDRDLVKEILEELGVERVFWRVNMKPGKPVYFGVRRETPVFGLPGNPVAALVTFELLVRPALLRWTGCSEEAPTEWARLATPVRKRAGRSEFARGRLENRWAELWAQPTAGQGAHMLSGITGADVLIYLPAEATELEEGAMVPVQRLTWRG